LTAQNNSASLTRYSAAQQIAVSIRVTPPIERLQPDAQLEKVKLSMLDLDQAHARGCPKPAGLSQQLTEENMRTLRMAIVGGFAGALMASNVATLNAAPLPTNVASMRSMVADNSIQVRWGGWRGGGWGYRGWGAGAIAGAVIGGAIASGAYGYYGGGPYYGGYYPGNSYYPVYGGYGWQAVQEPGITSFYRPYGYGGPRCCY
jgi:hypothetical protein